MPSARLQTPGVGPRIIFLNRFFFPDYSATSQILSDLAFYLAGCGLQVHVVTSRQCYDNPNADLPEVEAIDGVAIHRVSTMRFGRTGLIGRGFDYLSFHAAASRCILARARPGDVLVAKTDPPLLSVTAMQVARRRDLRLVNWLQDLYPEIASALRVPIIKGPVSRGLLQLRDASLRAADANVVVGGGMAEIVHARGIPRQRIRVIPNWCDDEEIQATPALNNPLRREWGLADRFVIGYSGNLGRAHEFETVLAAAELLREDQRLLFLFIGGGKKFAELTQCVRERRLDHLFRFLPYMDRKVLRYSLGVPDIHIVSLKPDLEGLIVPSKLYGIAAAGRPIIALAAKHGEIARLVQQHDCGLAIAPGDGKLFADTLRRLSTEKDRLTEMGYRARKMLEANFTRSLAFERWRSLIEEVALHQLCSGNHASGAHC